MLCLDQALGSAALGCCDIRISWITLMLCLDEADEALGSGALHCSDTWKRLVRMLLQLALMDQAFGSVHV